MDLERAYRKALSACGKPRPDTGDVAALLNPRGTALEALLFHAAHTARNKAVGAEAHLRGIIEFSNYCRQECLYCGLRRGNNRVNRYRMSAEEIVESARQAAKIYPLRTFVLQSGEDPGYPPEELAKAVRAIKSAGAAVTLSAGQRSRDDYALWRDAGADRYLMRLETCDAGLFGSLKPGTSLNERVECLENLRRLGYQVGTGIMLGLPGQSVDSIAKDLLYLKEFDPEMLSVGPFIPHPDTPLGSHDTGPALGLVLLTLRVMAVGRLLVPPAHIPGTTALATLAGRVKDWPKEAAKRGLSAPGRPAHEDARSAGLLCGGNVVMPDVTPPRFKKSYSIYPGKVREDGDEVFSSVRLAEEIIGGAGMKISAERGDSPKPPWGGNPG